jgi:hypothetical protein
MCKYKCPTEVVSQMQNHIDINGYTEAVKGTSSCAIIIDA